MEQINFKFNNKDKRFADLPSLTCKHNDFIFYVYVDNDTDVKAQQNIQVGIADYDGVPYDFSNHISLDKAQDWLIHYYKVSPTINSEYQKFQIECDS